VIRPRLIIFAKAPLMGRAKTRLAADIGQVQALRLYRAMVSRVLRQIPSPKWDSIIAVTPTNWIGRVPEWSGFDQIPQSSGDLSPRLSQAFSTKGPIVVIGTDCPQIKRADIDEAFNRLRSHQAVFGPAEDGGFWLIGLNGPVDPKIFENIRWSTSQALKDVEANIEGRVHYLRTLIDVDDLKALKALRARRRTPCSAH